MSTGSLHTTRTTEIQQRRTSMAITTGRLTLLAAAEWRGWVLRTGVDAAAGSPKLARDRWPRRGEGTMQVVPRFRSNGVRLIYGNDATRRTDAV